MERNLFLPVLVFELVRLSTFLPGVALGFAAIAMALSKIRRRTAVVIGTFALAGIVVGTILGFLFLQTPEAAGRLAGAVMQGGIIASSLWELVSRRKAAGGVSE